MSAKPNAAQRNPVVVCRMESQLGTLMKKHASSPRISAAKMNTRMMISSVLGSSMPKFFCTNIGSRNKNSTSRQMNALSYSPRIADETSVMRTIRRRIK